MKQKETYWLRFANDFEERNYYVIGKSDVELILGKASSLNNLKNVLELGRGNGNYSKVLAGNADLLLATDVSEEMVEASKNRLKTYFNVKVEKADCFNLPYPANSFDTVFMANLVHIIPNLGNAIRECTRVLKKGGLLIVTSYTHKEMRFRHKLGMVYRYLKTYGKPPRGGRNFGLTKASFLIQLHGLNIDESDLIAICIFLFFEDNKRFIHPETIKGSLMLIVASFGLLANLASVIILYKDKAHNLNVRAAYMHLLGDTFSSVAVIAGGAAICFWKIYWIDPLITVLVGIYIIWYTWGIVQETFDILIQSTPHNIDLAKIKQQIEELEDVDYIHHVHVWKLSDSQTHLEVHLNVKNNIDMATIMTVREKAETLLYEKFDIQHITLQVVYNCCCGNKLLIDNI